MESKITRLYFIDAIRAWAILMMLQGHFIDGLLDLNSFDTSNPVFSIWKYFRGITAPVFFTVSGFIFTYLLTRDNQKGLKNPRVKKGVRRGLELLFIGYLLRMNLFGLLKGEFYASFYLVDVLHCIGLSLLGIIGFYLAAQKYKTWVLPTLLISTTIILFVLEPRYSSWQLSALPDFFANYLTKANGSVFTIIPWFGYATFGAFTAIIFAKFKEARYLYITAICVCILMGFALIYSSSDLFLAASRFTGVQLFADVFFNNYLFIRLGDVLLVFAVFMLLRGFLKNPKILKIGQSTLSVYVVHFMLLYGSLTGLGLYSFFHHSLSPSFAVAGALLFMIAATYIALQYEVHKAQIHSYATTYLKLTATRIESGMLVLLEVAKDHGYRLLRKLGLLRN